MILSCCYTTLNDNLFAHLLGTLQCPNSSLNTISSRQRFSNASSWSTPFYWKPISSRRSMLSCEILRFDFIPFWIVLYAVFILLHHCPNDGYFANLWGTLQCPNGSLNAISSWQRFSNVSSWSKPFYWKPISSRRSMLSCERMYFDLIPFGFSCLLISCGHTTVPMMDCLQTFDEHSSVQTPLWMLSARRDSASRMPHRRKHSAIGS